MAPPLNKGNAESIHEQNIMNTSKIILDSLVIIVKKLDSLNPNKSFEDENDMGAECDNSKDISRVPESTVPMVDNGQASPSNLCIGKRKLLMPTCITVFQLVMFQLKTTSTASEK